MAEESAGAEVFNDEIVKHRETYHATDSQYAEVDGYSETSLNGKETFALSESVDDTFKADVDTVEGYVNDEVTGVAGESELARQYAEYMARSREFSATSDQSADHEENSASQEEQFVDNSDLSKQYAEYLATQGQSEKMSEKMSENSNDYEEQFVSKDKFAEDSELAKQYREYLGSQEQTENTADNSNEYEEKLVGKEQFVENSDLTKQYQEYLASQRQSEEVTDNAEYEETLVSKEQFVENSELATQYQEYLASQGKLDTNAEQFKESQVDNVDLPEQLKKTAKPKTPDKDSEEDLMKAQHNTLFKANTDISKQYTEYLANREKLEKMTKEFEDYLESQFEKNSEMSKQYEDYLLSREKFGKESEMSKQHAEYMVKKLTSGESINEVEKDVETFEHKHEISEQMANLQSQKEGSDIPEIHSGISGMSDPSFSNSLPENQPSKRTKGSATKTKTSNASIARQYEEYMAKCGAAETTMNNPFEDSNTSTPKRKRTPKKKKIEDSANINEFSEDGGNTFESVDINQSLPKRLKLENQDVSSLNSLESSSYLSNVITSQSPNKDIPVPKLEQDTEIKSENNDKVEGFETPVKKTMKKERRSPGKSVVRMTADGTEVLEECEEESTDEYEELLDESLSDTDMLRDGVKAKPGAKKSSPDVKHDIDSILGAGYFGRGLFKGTTVPKLDTSYLQQRVLDRIGLPTQSWSKPKPSLEMEESKEEPPKKTRKPRAKKTGTDRPKPSPSTSGTVNKTKSKLSAETLKPSVSNKDLPQTTKTSQLTGKKDLQQTPESHTLTGIKVLPQTSTSRTLTGKKDLQQTQESHMLTGIKDVLQTPDLGSGVCGKSIMSSGMKAGAINMDLAKQAASLTGAGALSTPGSSSTDLAQQAEQSKGKQVLTPMEIYSNLLIQMEATGELNDPMLGMTSKPETTTGGTTPGSTPKPGDPTSLTIKKRFACAECNKEYATSSSLRKHMYSHAEEKPHKCRFCQKGFTESSSLKSHEYIHTGEKPLKCHFCDMGFRSPSNLRRHFRVHTGEKPFKCEVCGKEFSQTVRLQSHMLLHTGETPYKCKYCGKGFRTPNQINSHHRTHTGERPFKCTMCDKTFSDSSNLRTHVRRHIGDKPHECEVCHVLFGFISDLKRHMLTHSKKKPFVCPHCNKGFTQSYTLNAHVAIHTGEGLQKCPVCKRNFTTLTNLRRHLLKHPEYLEEHPEIAKEVHASTLGGTRNTVQRISESGGPASELKSLPANGVIAAETDPNNDAVLNKIVDGAFAENDKDELDQHSDVLRNNEVSTVRGSRTRSRARAINSGAPVGNSDDTQGQEGESAEFHSMINKILGQQVFDPATGAGTGNQPDLDTIAEVLKDASEAGTMDFEEMEQVGASETDLPNFPVPAVFPS